MISEFTIAACSCLHTAALGGTHSMPQDEEIRSIMQEEKSRGVRRKRVDTEERKKIQKTKTHLARVLAEGDERAFMKIMREIGLKDDSPEFLNALKTFREHFGRR
jgi:hypothetical protein